MLLKMRLSIVGLFFILTPVVAGQDLLQYLSSPAENNCNTLMDLFIVLDSSGSIGAVAFEQAKNALADLVSRLQIAPKKVQVWVINYGQIVETPISFHNMPLSEFTKENLIRQIKLIRYMDGSCTATGDALREVRNICDRRCRSIEQGVSRVVLVLTDGNSNCGTLVGPESSNLLHVTKASVFAVGIGYGINNLELQTIATDKKYIVHVDDYLLLPASINNITVQTCGIPAFVIPNVKVESEVPLNNYRYYQLDTTELVNPNALKQGGYVEIIANVKAGQVDVFTSTQNQNPGIGTGKRVNFRSSRSGDQYFIEYIDQNAPRLFFSFLGLQNENEYDFIVKWFDEVTLIG